MFKKIISLLKALKFQSNLEKAFYEEQIGHSKIIAYENGYPLHSLIFPSVYSKQFELALKNNLVGLANHRKQPEVVKIAVTDKCDCKCSHCTFEQLREKREVLSWQEIAEVIENAIDLGCVSFVATGGEPLMQENIYDIIKRVCTDKAAFILFTNGARLEDAAFKLKEAGLNRLFVSIDYPDAERHDKYRGSKGLFDKAIKGLKKAKEAGLLIGISTTIYDDFTLNDLRRIIELGKELKVNEFYINTMISNTTPLPENLENDISQEVFSINKNKKYKFGIYYYPYICNPIHTGCAAGSRSFYVSPYGDMLACETVPYSFGNLREEKMYQIWNKMISHEELGCFTFRKCKAGQKII